MKDFNRPSFPEIARTAAAAAAADAVAAAAALGVDTNNTVSVTH